MGATAVERYVRLGLRLGRHDDGVVDAYFGPPEIAAAVDAEPPVDLPALIADADALVAELGDGWLRDQAIGLRTYAGVLAGDERPYGDEVHGCFGVHAAFTDESAFRDAHERLEQLLPGDGPLAERHDRWRDSLRVPPERVGPVVEAAIGAVRDWMPQLLALPSGEDVDLEVVRDRPWLAYCRYLGGLRSRISVNVSLPISAVDLLHLAIHETYPGHHAERCAKEEALVQGRGLVEETLVLLPAPQSLVSEGIAELATSWVLEGDAGERLAGVLREAGIELDLGHALAVERARAPCRWAAVNAALLLHEEGRSEAEARAYLERWALLGRERAAHVAGVLADRSSRAYAVTYPAGRDLCERYVAGDPARFRRLLTEQVRVGELLAPAA